MTTDVTLRQSYRHCGRIARGAASSFYWSFWLLPREKRLAMYAIYAFSRRVDDIADDFQPDSSSGNNQLASVRQRLSDCRRSLENALGGHCDDPLLPALVDTIHQYDIPKATLFDIIEGVEMDIEPRRYETFEDLSQYCYRVASAVGLACIHIWGFESEAAHEPAIKCGLAFQLTNILRDLKEDAQRGRIYLPLADLRQFDYSPEELIQGVQNEQLTALLHFEIQRTEQLYSEASLLHEHLMKDGRKILSTMMSTYRLLLEEIKRNAEDTFNHRAQLSSLNKLTIVATHFFSR